MLIDRLETQFFPFVEKPARYIGGEMGAVVGATLATILSRAVHLIGLVILKAKNVRESSFGKV